MHDLKYDESKETLATDDVSDSLGTESRHIKPQARKGNKEWCKRGNCEFTLLVRLLVRSICENCITNTASQPGVR